MRKTGDPISLGVENGLRLGAVTLEIASRLEMSSLVAESTGEPPMGTGSPAMEVQTREPRCPSGWGVRRRGPPPEPSQAGRWKERLVCRTVLALNHTLPVSNREAVGS